MPDFILGQYLKKKRQGSFLGSSEITRAIINSASSGIYIVQDSKFTYVSPLFIQQSGYREQEILGKKSLSFIYPEDREKVRASAIACLKGINTTPYEYRFVHKNGTLLWILEKVASAEIRGKKAAVGSFMNITEYKKLEESLRKSEEFNTNLIDNAPNPIMLANMDSSIKYVNRALEELTGFSLKELQGKKIPYPYWSDETVEEATRGFQSLLKTGGISMKELAFQKKSGDKFWVEASVAVVGNPPYILSNWIDITPRKSMENDLKLKVKLLDEATDSIIVHDLSGNIIYANEAACKIRGYSYDELLRHKIQQLISPRNRWIFTEQLPQLLEKGDLIYEIESLRKDASVIPMEVHSRVISADSERLIISVAHDVTERKKAEAELVHMATHDALTDLPNRSLLDDRLQMALAQAERNRKRLAVMMLDLDKFKLVNDEFGHGIGDRLLKNVGERLVRMLRKSDTVARFGGDEFFIILPEIASIEDAGKLAQKVIKAFRKPFTVDEHKLNITTSIGIAVFPDDGSEPDSLMRNADNSMYRAKQKGRDMYEFHAQYGLQL